MDDQIALAVHGGGVTVDQHQMFSAEVAEKTGGRIDGQAGAGDDHQVRFGDGVNGAGNHCVIKTFFIKHDVRLDTPAAFAVGNGFLAVANEVSGEKFPAFHTVIPVDAAMEFKNFFAAGSLVETVDVLGDYSHRFHTVPRDPSTVYRS